MSYVNPKSFFEVTVGGFLSVEPCPTASRYRGGTIPRVPRFPNNCSGWLGYLGK